MKVILDQQKIKRNFFKEAFYTQLENMRGGTHEKS